MNEPSAGNALLDPPPRRVVLLRALQLGDMLCAVPALRSLRAAMPDAEIDLVGLPWARSFVSRFRRYVDGFIEFPGFPGLPERPPRVGRFPGFLGYIQARGYDLAVQMHGSGSFVNPLTALFGARHCAGFFTPGDYCPDARRFLPYPDNGLEIRRLLSLVRFLGGPDVGEDLEFPLDDEDFARLRATNGADTLRVGEYVCLHPGASVPERRWPVSGFAAVARDLSARGLRVILTGASAERDVTSAVAAASGVRCLDLAGQTDLGSLGALLSEARLIVTNDTGVAHLAVAVGLPGVIVSTGRNPERWAPVDHACYPVLCRNEGVSVYEILKQVHKLLDTRSSRRTLPACEELAGTGSVGDS